MSELPASPSAVDRIYQALKIQIENHLKPGDALPSSRTLVEQHQASPNTVQKALSRLTQEGWVVTRTGKGAFVADRKKAPPPAADHGWQQVLLGARPPIQEDFKALYTPVQTGILPLGSGYLDASLQPTNLLAQAMQKASRRPLVWERISPEGLEPLRNWFAQELGVQATDTLITSGAQTALSTVFGVLARQEGQTVLVESPCHLGTLAVLRAAGFKPVPVPGDDQGLRPDFLEQLLVQTGARILSCQPTFNNPTGTTWTLERRRQVLDLCARHGVLVVEDGATQMLYLHTPPPPPLVQLSPDQVVHICSLTKPVAAGFRIAAICARGPVLERLRTALVVDDLFVTGVMQEAALEVLTSQMWTRHLKATREALLERQQALLQGVKQHLPEVRLATRPAGGFYLWAGLPAGTDDVEVARQALLAGVQVNPGRHWFPAEPAGPFLRLSCAAAGPETLLEGTRLLGRVLEQMLNSSP